MPLNFFKDSVTVIRAPFINKNGQQTYDWAHAQQFVVDRVQVTPQATSRTFEGRVEQVTDRRTLRASYNADIQAGDRVMWKGDTYEIDGEVFHTESPTGRVSSTRCSLVKWSG